ncbi:hypothetical protein ACFU3E_17010 [Streptomyces sp. NPDC057424]|uniref:hypothetical protein n=1 Tax=Streptomyces sp. NPDC057424 TaxID=3346127 RepID=UPI0036C53A67
MSTPVWWPQIVRAADRRRHVTGLLLAHATPSVDGGVLRLQFDDPGMARAWEDSGAQVALEAALRQYGIDVQVDVAIPQPALMDKIRATL